MKKVLVALSGGVDSSVAAHLLKAQGYKCIGATMRLLDGADGQIADAKAVADRIGIPFYEFDLRKEFRELVIDEFIKSYENGDTPNPCVVCNKQLKFGLLLEKAIELGCDFIATGHYAQIESIDGRFVLKKAETLEKDQSYFLYSLPQEALSRVLFPLGGYSKPEIRAIAEGLGLVTAKKKDSQDICFVPDGDYIKVIEDYTDKTYPKGNFIDVNGNILGQHQGIIRYTTGQRKGLGVAFGKPMYVGRKNVTTNEVTLCSDAELYSDTLKAVKLNWIAFPTPPKAFECSARIRYRHVEQPATVTVDGDTATVKFDQPQRAATSGQSVVFYDGDLVLGGGIIK